MAQKLDEPVIGEKSLEMNVSNEGGYGGKINFLKNLTGLWMVQESRRQWIREGNEYSFGELETQAKEVELFQKLCGCQCRRICIIWQYAAQDS